MSGVEAPAIRVRGIGKAYPPPIQNLRVLLGQMLGERRTPIPVLQDLSFEVPRGATVGIVGANGAGKTTLLKIVGGILAPTVGEVERAGRVGSIFRLDVGVVPELTGRENALSIARVRGLDEARALELLPWIEEFSELGAFFDRPLRTYSAGMRARLAFAAISADAPEILIVDEALAVGDLRFTQKCNRRFAELRGSGRTILLVSHDLAQVYATCERVLWVERGRIVHDGPPADAIARYRSHVDAQTRAYAAQQAAAVAPLADPRLVLSFHDGEHGPDAALFSDAPRAILRLEGSALVPGRRVRLQVDSAMGPRVLDSTGDVRGARLELVLEPLLLGRGRYRATASVDTEGAPIVARREFFVEWTHDEVRSPKLSRSPARWSRRVAASEVPR